MSIREVLEVRRASGYSPIRDGRYNWGEWPHFRETRDAIRMAAQVGRQVGPFYFIRDGGPRGPELTEWRPGCCEVLGFLKADGTVEWCSPRGRAPSFAMGFDRRMW